MEKRIICVISLVIGTGLGFLLAKTKPMSGLGAPGPTVEAPGVTVAAISASKSGQRTVAGSKRGNINQFLSLVNSYNST